MRKSLALLICAGVVFSNANLEAITTKKRIKQMFGWGSVAAMIAYVLQSPGQVLTCPNPFKIEKEGDKITQLLNPSHKPRFVNSLGAGAAMAIFVNWVTSYYTPSYCLTWAEKERSALNKSVLFTHAVCKNNMKEILIASGAESSALPYVEVFLHLTQMDARICRVKNVLEGSLKDCEAGSHLGMQIANLIDQLESDLIRLRESEHNIKNYDVEAWSRQWDVHNRTQLQKEKIAAMNAPKLHYHIR